MATESKVEETERQDSKASMQGGLNETEISNSIKSLQEESQQISELAEMEKTYSLEVSNQLKQLIMPLNASYHIKPQSVSKNDSSISDAVLTPQGVVCVFYSSGTVVSRPLESIASEVLIKILSEVIPDVKALMYERRQKLSGRVMTLEKLSKEMRKVPTAGGRTKQAAQGGLEQTLGNSNARDKSASSQDAMRSAFGEK
ncbi:MAG TPA: hypothetical protein VNE86_01405 [Nitrososphaerales archaeon]|nr:hypothetical protein [Nitrososphaerales archaeon]